MSCTEMRSNKSLQPTPAGVVSSADAGHAVVPAWLSFMRPLPRCQILLVALVCSLTSGCAGFINGYMAHPRLIERDGVRTNQMFLALKADVELLADKEKRVAPAMRPFAITYLVADMPVSLAADLFFLPFAAVGQSVHRNKPPQEVIEYP